MEFTGLIHGFPKPVKFFILFFILALTFGYFSGFTFLERTTGLNPAGIEKNYNGNENDPSAEEVKFKMPEKQLLNIIHSHVLSMSLIFFALGILLLTTSLPPSVKYFLLIEPYIALLLTFGGLWLLWKGQLWMRYVVMFSGILLVASFVTSVVLILWQLFKKAE